MRAYLEELGLPKHDVHLDLKRLRRLSIEALAALSDEELAERVGVPVSVAPVLRGARDLREAREYAQQVLEPERVEVDAPETLQRFRELVEGGVDPRGIVRELKAVGGDLKAVRLALTGRERGPELCGRDRRAAARRAARAHRSRLDAMRLYNTLSRQLEELPPPPRARSGCTSAGRRSTSARTSGTRGRSCSACGCATGCATAATTRRSSTTSPTSTTRSTTRRRARARSSRRARREWYLEDIGGFGLGLPDALPKATEHIPGIVRFIEELIERGNAYAVEGDVYFRVASDPGYGRLSGQRPDQMERAGAESRSRRIRATSRSGRRTSRARTPSWESPWGRGRPGWHIECSVMAEEELGPEFELHGGGLDLVFPHHENELAQSSALGHRFARIWTHNGMLEFGGEKMSKSLGNDVSIRNVLDTWGREVALLFFMTAHWRKPIDFTDVTLEQAKAQWQSFGQAIYASKPPRPSRRRGRRSRRRSTTTSIRPRRSRFCTSGGARASSSCSTGA